jgi:hypothetical protein
MYWRCLNAEGYVPTFDRDGDVVFKCEGASYIIFVDEEDDEFFRLVIPNIWSIKSEDDRAQVERAAVHATAKTKVAKVFTVGDDAWASIEMFCSPPTVFRAVFPRSLRALQAGVKNFLEAMKES